MVLDVAILGASDDPERYSNKALHMLLEYGHKVYPIHPKLKTIEGHKVYANLDEIKVGVHTLTVYVRPEISILVKEHILKLKPQRVIFNPGSENAELASVLQAAGVKIENACTLVMLRTNQF